MNSDGEQTHSNQHLSKRLSHEPLQGRVYRDSSEEALEWDSAYQGMYGGGFKRYDFLLSSLLFTGRYFLTDSDIKYILK